MAVHVIQTLMHLTGAVRTNALDLQSHVLVLGIEQLSIGRVKSESVAAVAVQQHARSFAGSAVTVTLRKVEEVGRRTLCGVIAHDRGLWWCGSSHHLMARWLCLTRRGGMLPTRLSGGHFKISRQKNAHFCGRIKGKSMQVTLEFVLVNEDVADAAPIPGRCSTARRLCVYV
jgi:hypothetical protein